MQRSANAIHFAPLPTPQRATGQTSAPSASLASRKKRRRSPPRRPPGLARHPWAQAALHGGAEDAESGRDNDDEDDDEYEGSPGADEASAADDEHRTSPESVVGTSAWDVVDDVEGTRAAAGAHNTLWPREAPTASHPRPFSGRPASANRNASRWGPATFEPPPRKRPHLDPAVMGGLSRISIAPQVSPEGPPSAGWKSPAYSLGAPIPSPIASSTPSTPPAPPSSPTRSPLAHQAPGRQPTLGQPTHVSGGFASVHVYPSHDELASVDIDMRTRRGPSSYRIDPHRTIVTSLDSSSSEASNEADDETDDTARLKTSSGRPAWRNGSAGLDGGDSTKGGEQASINSALLQKLEAHSRALAASELAVKSDAEPPLSGPQGNHRASAGYSRSGRRRRFARMAGGRESGSSTSSSPPSSLAGTPINLTRPSTPNPALASLAATAGRLGRDDTSAGALVLWKSPEDILGAAATAATAPTSAGPTPRLVSSDVEVDATSPAWTTSDPAWESTTPTHTNQDTGAERDHAAFSPTREAAPSGFGFGAMHLPSLTAAPWPHGGGDDDGISMVASSAGDAGSGGGGGDGGRVASSWSVTTAAPSVDADMELDE